MRILSANVNGLHGAVTNGFFTMPHVLEADVLCLQGTRCEDAASVGMGLGYYALAVDRTSQGGGIDRGGVAIFAKQPLTSRAVDGDDMLASNGQFISCTLGDLAIASVYVTMDAQPQQFPSLAARFAALASEAGGAVICGDMNTFRDEHDAWNFAESSNKGSYGCDPTAMAWFAQTFNAGWTDAVGLDYKPRPLYTWWSRNELYHRGDGTRLDYILLSPVLTMRLTSGSAQVSSQKRFGGHAQIAVSIGEG
jgi:exodeoxyribonuclease-3